MFRTLPRLSHVRFPAVSNLHTVLRPQRIVVGSNNRVLVVSMSTNTNADISKMKNEEDGAFRRKPSSFRSHITKDGQYTPEKGMLLYLG